MGDKETWVDHCGDSCSWYAENDPGCLIYENEEHFANCGATCNKCNTFPTSPPESSNSILISITLDTIITNLGESRSASQELYMDKLARVVAQKSALKRDHVLIVSFGHDDHRRVQAIFRLLPSNRGNGWMEFVKSKLEKLKEEVDKSFKGVGIMTLKGANQADILDVALLKMEVMAPSASPVSNMLQALHSGGKRSVLYTNDFDYTTYNPDHGRKEDSHQTSKLEKSSHLEVLLEGEPEQDSAVPLPSHGSLEYSYRICHGNSKDIEAQALVNSLHTSLPINCFSWVESFDAVLSQVQALGLPLDKTKQPALPEATGNLYIPPLEDAFFLRQQFI